MTVLKLTADRSDVRLDRYIADEVEILSRSKAQSNIKAHHILVDGTPAKPSLLLNGGELIQIDLQEDKDMGLEPEEMDLEILFEDEDLVAISKPAGMVVHPGAGNFSGTLVNGLIYHFNKLSELYGSQRPGIVHRLDKDTSGVLLIAKNDSVHMKLAKQFADRMVTKVYLALVWGTPSETKGVITGSLERHPNDRKKFTVSKEGRQAETHFRVLESLEDFSLIELRPKTGRTHQLRVHMQHIGYPIFADDIYGGGLSHSRGLSPQIRKNYSALHKLMPRQALHALSISFVHPGTGQEMEITAPLPGDFRNVLAQLEPISA